jgi:hypothetical protein
MAPWLLTVLLATAGLAAAASGTPLFIEHKITDDTPYATSVSTSDLDGDADPDVFSTSSIDDEVAWHASDETASPTFIPHTVTSSAEVANYVIPRDVDGDQDMDLLSASTGDDKIHWYENDGNSTPSFTTHVITINADRARVVFAEDVDGDNEIDVLSASCSDDKIAWYENDGADPPNFATRIISTNAEGATAVASTDMDGDEDVDVLASAHSSGKISWYEHIETHLLEGSTLLANAPPVLSSPTNVRPKPSATPRSATTPEPPRRTLPWISET